MARLYPRINPTDPMEPHTGSLVAPLRVEARPGYIGGDDIEITAADRDAAEAASVVVDVAESSVGPVLDTVEVGSESRSVEVVASWPKLAVVESAAWVVGDMDEVIGADVGALVGSDVVRSSGETESTAEPTVGDGPVPDSGSPELNGDGPVWGLATAAATVPPSSGSAPGPLRAQ